MDTPQMIAYARGLAEYETLELEIQQKIGAGCPDEIRKLLEHRIRNLGPGTDQANSIREVLRNWKPGCGSR